MFKMYRFMVLVLCITLLFAGCGNSGSNGVIASDMELYDAGIEITSVMGDMVRSKAYAEIMGLSESCEEVLEMVDGANYDSPISVYRITFPESEEFLKVTGQINGDLLDELSPEVREQFMKRVNPNSVVITAFNASYGADAMAFAATYTASSKSDTLSIEKPTLLLYIFEKGKPIAVTFNEDGSITGQFVFLENIETLSDVEAFFEKPCEVSVIK